MQNFRETARSGNLILDALPPADWKWLQPRLETVELQQRTLLQPLRNPVTTVFFPTTCLLSWTNSTELGETVEVGLTGREGLVGVPLLLGETVSPWQIEVLIAGSACKLTATDFLAALEYSSYLRQGVASFTYLKLVQLNQSALCNRFHSLEERLCRWLLDAQDHSGTSQFFLTRDTLAQMIGAGRPAVSLTTGVLQSAGLIRSNRGEIALLNREGIEEAACECYRVTRAASERHLGKLGGIGKLRE